MKTGGANDSLRGIDRYAGEFYSDTEYLIGERDDRFWSVVYEELEDELGELVWLVTFWPSTAKEVERYYRHVHGE